MTDDAAFAAMNKRSERNGALDGGVEATPTFVVDGKKRPAGFHTRAKIERALA